MINRIVPLSVSYFVVLSLLFGCSIKADDAVAQDSSKSSASSAEIPLSQLLQKMAPQLDTFSPISIPKGRRQFLQASVIHSDKLPPLPYGVSVGNTFDKSVLPDPYSYPENAWYEIPEWMAGRVACRSTVLYYKYDYTKKEETHPNEEGEGYYGRFRGMFKDADGKIWQRSYGSDYSITDEGKYKIYKIENEIVGVINSDKEYSECSTGQLVYIDRANNKIAGIQRYERIRTYFLKPSDVIVKESSDKLFDGDGEPLLETKIRQMMYKAASYHSLEEGKQNEFYENDAQVERLAKDFVCFLIKRDLASLIPADLKQYEASAKEAIKNQSQPKPIDADKAAPEKQK